MFRQVSDVIISVVYPHLWFSIGELQNMMIGELMRYDYISTLAERNNSPGIHSDITIVRTFFYILLYKENNWGCVLPQYLNTIKLCIFLIDTVMRLIIANVCFCFEISIIVIARDQETSLTAYLWTSRLIEWT